MKIEQAENGFVVTKENGDLYIYKTLREMADDIEGRPYTPAPVITNNIVYAADKNVNDLANVRHLAAKGYKIDAIKELRSMYSTTMGLKEAKDIVEQLMIALAL